jgi:DNA-binding SARP family transcriptional activator
MEPPMPLLRTLGTAALVEQTPAGEYHLDIQPKRLALLVFLRRGGREAYTRRETLLALFWPDADDEHGRGALRQSLSALRRRLGLTSLMTLGTEEVGLTPASLTCDAEQFEAACAAGEHDAALGLYRGHFLEGFHPSGVAQEFEEWVEAERTRLRRMAAAAAGSLVDTCESGGRSAEAIRAARRAVELAPEDETGVARLIALLDRQGDRSGALVTYTELERRLADEFAASPAPETRALMQSLLQRPTPSVAAAAAATAEVAPPDGPSEASDAPARPAPMQRPRRLLLVGALAGALAVVTLALVLGSVRHRETRAHMAVAIMPFHVSAADTALGWLREGMVELLAIRLMGEGGMDVIEPTRSIAAWQHQRRKSGADASDARASEAIAALGAGRMIAGAVRGTSRHVVLSASLTTVPSGRRSALATVEGSVDSLPHLVDRLAAELLGREAGIEDDRLASLTSASPAAVRAFLAGRAAFRVGRREEARQRFQDALALDSTFALAGLDMMLAARWIPGAAADVSTGARLAQAHQERLAPADRALLDALARSPTVAPELFAAWSAVVIRYPGRAEVWYALGDEYRATGRLAGLDAPLRRAEDAYRSGWQLDSAAGNMDAGGRPLHIIEPMERLIELVHARGDTAEVRRLAARVLAADSSSELARVVRWHVAVLDGDEARRAYWAHFGTASLTTTRGILLFMIWTGIGLEDFDRASAEDMRRALVSRPVRAVTVQRWTALYRGRPSRVPPVGAPEFGPREDLRIRLRDAVWWNADTTDALAAARELARLTAEAGRRGPATLDDRRDRCALGLWHAARSELSQADSAARWLRRMPALPAAAQHDELCLALLAAAGAAGRRDPAARTITGIADSLARTYVFAVSGAITDANLLLARIWEQQGDAPRALRAVQRGASEYSSRPIFLSTLVRETGRLAALTGDTALARASYRHFLALHDDPDPALAREVALVRTALAELSPK